MDCLSDLRDFEIITSENKNELLHLVRRSKKKVIFRARSEEMLRFALEKAPVFGVIGLEKIHPKDSVHFVRSGLDQILGQIAARKGKAIFFSFADILKEREKGKLMARMKLNWKLCRKYKLKCYFLADAVSETDLRSFLRVLEKEKCFKSS